MGLFSHQPLDLNGRNIRLLRLGKSHTDVIVCDLRHAPLGEDHVCLSYMWGLDAPRHSVYINGGILKVRDNLFQFLQTAKRLKIYDWLWIDALCIDQENVKERNHQVQYMGAIYQQAKHVLIYPGKISWTSTIVNESFREEEKFEIRYPKLGSLINPVSTLVHNLTQSVLLEPQDFPYWNRLWIVQELALAKLRYVVTDSKLLSWKQFLSTYSSYGSSRIRRNGQPSVWELCQPHTSIDNRNQDIEQLIGKFSTSDCEDIRDHVYGLVSLARPKPSFSVNYGIGKISLFVAVLNDCKHRILGSGISDMLATLGGVTSGLRIELTYICGTCTVRPPEKWPEFSPPGVQNLFGNPLLAEAQRTIARVQRHLNAVTPQMPALCTALWIVSDMDETFRSRWPVNSLCETCALGSREISDNYTLSDIEAFDDSERVFRRILLRWTQRDALREVNAPLILPQQKATANFLLR